MSYTIPCWYMPAITSGAAYEREPRELVEMGGPKTLLAGGGSVGAISHRSKSIILSTAIPCACQAKASNV